jgi:hypothetical protein
MCSTHVVHRERFKPEPRSLNVDNNERMKNHPHTKEDGSWWEYDAQGIPLVRVCDACRKAKLSRFRPEILSGYTQADVDEQIEPDYGYGEERI